MTEMNGSAVRLKAELLSYGLAPTTAFLDAYGPPFLEKRRAYGNSDDLSFVKRRLPQELWLLPERIICAVNVRPASPWLLDFASGNYFIRRADGSQTCPITFPRRPEFYNSLMSDGKPVNGIITLYGGGSLGIFAYGGCSLVTMGAACQYCSIQPNRDRQTEFPQVITETTLSEALFIALRDSECPIKQVMINGGNFPDLNGGFRYYTKLVRCARNAINVSGRTDVELHLIVYPPADLNLLEGLRGLDVSVAMNTEVFDANRFRQICPGKSLISGQSHIIDALLRAAKVLEIGHVFSIFVGGLEQAETMDTGMAFLASHGVVPVINVFHADPNTPLQQHPLPAPAEILRMGASLQKIYTNMPQFKPFYLDCGRNSIDTEAYRRLF